MSRPAGPLKVLLLLDQLPQDPASGAARTCQTMCEYLAADPGCFAVRALATTATEKGQAVDASALLAELGVRVQRRDEQDLAVLRFAQKGVAYTLLKTRVAHNAAWEGRDAPAFDRLFDQELQDHRPDVVLTYGGHRNMVRRWRRARAVGAKIVFGLWNHGYLKNRRFFDEVDAVLTPSRFLTDTYQRRLGLDSTPLPSPLDLGDVVAPDREPVFLTYVNPAIDKGVMFVARFADVLARRRPDVPLMVVESRGTAGTLVAAGLNGGFDLRAHRNIVVSPGVPRPRDFFAVTRVLLAPSVWDEPSGRVASEALVNGVPPIVSDRGGLAEECRGAGVVLPLPENLTTDTRVPVAPAAVEPWLDAALGLVDDQARYAAASQRAREVGKHYHPDALARRYIDFFLGVAAGSPAATQAGASAPPKTTKPLAGRDTRRA